MADEQLLTLIREIVREEIAAVLDQLKKVMPVRDAEWLLSPERSGPKSVRDHVTDMEVTLWYSREEDAYYINGRKMKRNDYPDYHDRDFYSEFTSDSIGSFIIARKDWTNLW